MKTQLSGGLEPTKYYGRAKDARPSTHIASRWRGLKVFLLCMVFPCSQMVVGQSVRYSCFYDNNGGAGGFLDVIQLSNGNLQAVGSDFNLTDNHGHDDGFHVQVDGQGELLYSYRFSETDKSFNVRSIIHSNFGSAVFTAGYHCDYSVDSPGYCDFYLAKLDQTGDTLFTKVYARPDTSDYLLDIVQTRPNKLLLIGWTYNDTVAVSSAADLLFITVDTLGNELNRVVWGGAGTDYVHSACVKDDDGSVLMTGYTLSFGAGNGKSWVLETDSVGNVLWHEIYNGLSSQGDGGIGLSKLESDGNFIVVGGINYPNGSDAYMLKIEPDGTEIWRKRFQIPRHQGLYKAEELPDGSILACGQTTHTDDNSQAGWLIKTDEHGDTLWTRTYNPSPLIDRLLNMLVMPNGDIVMIGDGRAPGQTNQDGWILRVDSMGCLEEGCHVVGVNEQLTMSNEQLTIWPNPANESFRVKVSGSKSQDLSITATDMQGRAFPLEKGVAEGRGISSEGIGSMDISRWPNGIYLITLTDNDGNRHTQRLVVLH